MIAEVMTLRSELANPQQPTSELIRRANRLIQEAEYAPYSQALTILSMMAGDKPLDWPTVFASETFDDVVVALTGNEPVITGEMYVSDADVYTFGVTSPANLHAFSVGAFHAQDGRFLIDEVGLRELNRLHNRFNRTIKSLPKVIQALDERWADHQPEEPF